MKNSALFALILVGLAALPCWATESVSVVQNPDKTPWSLSNTLPVGAAYQLIYENPVTHAVELLVRFPSGYQIPLHYHSQTETIAMISGKMRMTIDGKVSTLTRGSYAVIPAGTRLTLANAGWGSCEFVSSFDGPFDVLGLPKNGNP